MIERNVVRAVALDAIGNVLLLHVRDVGDPSFGTSWELPGGGIEEGETFVDAVVRELREETGLHVTAANVSEPTWRRVVIYTYRRTRRLHHEAVAVVRLHSEMPRIEGAQRSDFEAEDCFESRWWSVSAIVASDERFYPRSLPLVLPRILAGDEIDEPLEIWP
jgi:8-oxo-dGTP pyrophosphatase MutT (NUDIX family)